MHSVTRTKHIFPVVEFEVMYRLILLTRFCKLLITVTHNTSEARRPCSAWLCTFISKLRLLDHLYSVRLSLSLLLLFRYAKGREGAREDFAPLLQCFRGQMMPMHIPTKFEVSMANRRHRPHGRTDIRTEYNA